MQPSSCCPTALPGPAQPTQSVKDTEHPTLNAGSTKIVLPEITPGQTLAGWLQRDTLTGTKTHKGFCWKSNYSFPAFCRMQEVQPAPDLHSQQARHLHIPDSFWWESQNILTSSERKSIPWGSKEKKIPNAEGYIRNKLNHVLLCIFYTSL